MKGRVAGRRHAQSTLNTCKLFAPRTTARPHMQPMAIMPLRKHLTACARSRRRSTQRTSRMRILRPSISVSLNASTARPASSGDANSTMAQPLERPSGCVMMDA